MQKNQEEYCRIMQIALESMWYKNTRLVVSSHFMSLVFLQPLKTSENLRFDIFKGYRKSPMVRNGLEDS